MKIGCALSIVSIFTTMVDKPVPAEAVGLRRRTASRVRYTDSIANRNSVPLTPEAMLEKLEAQRLAIDEQFEEDENMMAAMEEAGFDFLGDFNGGAFSMLLTAEPTPSMYPSVSVYPSSVPTASDPDDSSMTPTESVYPSSTPTTSQQPSLDDFPGAEPIVTDSPSSQPTESSQPSLLPSGTPTTSSMPSQGPSSAPTTSQSPSELPTSSPSTSPSPTSSPTLEGCNVSPIERAVRVMEELDLVADPVLIRDFSTPQGKATTWILMEDERRICQGDPKLIQRWVMAVMYFSTGGDNWIQCSADGVDPCGDFFPFQEQKRFLSSSNECEWAGITCNADACVTEIEFEENNLVGTLPSEIALLPELAVWGMERGGLTGSIPTEIGKLSKLIFLDLDFNSITGSIPTQLYTLTDLTQLDLNNNQMTGNVNGIGSFPKIEFLQLHSNFFSGEIPEAVGTFNLMGTFNVHETNVTGAMPAGLCSLLAINGGNLTSLIADCDEPSPGVTPEITCDCCTDCRGA